MEFISTATSFVLAVVGGALVYRWPKSKWRSIVKWEGLAIFLLIMSSASAEFEYYKAKAEIYNDQPSATCSDAFTQCLLTGDTQACGVNRLCTAVAEQRAQDEELGLSRNYLKSRLTSMLTSMLWDFPVEVTGVFLGVILAGGRPKLSYLDE